MNQTGYTSISGAGIPTAANPGIKQLQGLYGVTTKTELSLLALL